MALRYLESISLGRGEANNVCALAFSPSGTLLASAGLDGKACIWNLSDGRLLHVFSSAVPILSLTWAAHEEDKIVCGLQDGSVASLFITQADLLVTGFWAHTYPVECLTIKGDLLASGAHEEVRVWRRVGTEWTPEHHLPSPPRTSFNRLLSVIVTSVHWLSSSSKDNAYLLVTYLNHGVHIFNSSTWEHTRSIPIPGQIADASLSKDGKLIAISNVSTGFDVYSVQSGQAICSLGHTIDEFRKVPVLFIHDGLAVVGGNVKGDVHLWDVHSGRKLHSLHHRKDNQILALAAHYDPNTDTFLIATGALYGSSNASIVLWKAQELGRDGDGSSQQENTQRPPISFVPYFVTTILVLCFVNIFLSHAISS